MIRAVRRAIRWVGWLLTPLVAGAAAFLGAWLGAAVADRVAGPRAGLVVMVFGALGAAWPVTWWWVRALRGGRAGAPTPPDATNDPTSVEEPPIP